jgi:hypothetical protein
VFWEKWLLRDEADEILLFPICSHFLESKGTMRDCEGSTWLEIVGVLKQIQCSSMPSLASHGGDRGSKPLGTACNIKELQ